MLVRRASRERQCRVVLSFYRFVALSLCRFVCAMRDADAGRKQNERGRWSVPGLRYVEREGEGGERHGNGPGRMAGFAPGEEVGWRETREMIGFSVVGDRGEEKIIAGSRKQATERSRVHRRAGTVRRKRKAVVVFFVYRSFAVCTPFFGGSVCWRWGRGFLLSNLFLGGRTRKGGNTQKWFLACLVSSVLRGTRAC